MRIAVPYEDGNISDHFGRTETFKLYDTEGQDIQDTQLVKTEGRGHFYMVQFLTQHQVDLVLCQSMGNPSRNALKIAGITPELGWEGNADDAVKEYLQQ